MRIVFFGTPEFAVPSLRALLRERYQVVGVVTQPDKPQGRSRSTLVAPPVKQEAARAGRPVLQPVRPLATSSSPASAGSSPSSASSSPTAIFSAPTSSRSPRRA